MITAFVSVMMLLVEYVNVLTAGAWQRRLAERRWGQYLLGALLGTTPGCLGAFAAVAMYSHGGLTLGAVVTTMIATSGDESFVMLALIPKQALAVFGILSAFGIVVGALVDALTANRRTRQPADCLEIHVMDRCEYYPRGRILEQWRECSAVRGTLAIVLILFLAAALTGQLGPSRWDWIRSSLVFVSLLALFVVSTVPDHFLEDHLWRHVIRRHSPRVLVWTLGALVAMQLLTNVLHLESVAQEGKWALLVAACVVGLIPESGPHIIFVTLYANGVIPLSILLASSIVQDGHGMLPMLAHSRREFVLIKAINLCAGLGFGSFALAIGS
jgi:hypothetical protein